MCIYNHSSQSQPTTLKAHCLAIRKADEQIEKKKKVITEKVNE